MKKIILFPLCIATLLAAGCSTPAPSAPPVSATPPPKTETLLEGTWKGHELTPDHPGSASLTFAGPTLEFHGADPDDWVKGTYTLREDTSPKQWVGVITDCASPNTIGKTVNAIYKMEDGTLTISGNEPGNPNFPASFDAPGCREFVLKHAQ